MRLSKKLLLLAIFVSVAIVNIRFGKIIMGFDNSSPFFSAAATLSRIFSTDNFIHYGGMLFSPALLFSILQIPAWINSHLTYFGALTIGMFFASLLIIEQFPKNKIENKLLFVALIILGNLVPIWTFSLPILIFAPSFAGIPALLYFLTHKTQGSKLDRIFIGLLLFFGIYYFYSTSINVAAFSLYFIETIILALVLRNDQTVKIVLKKAALVAMIWVIIVQSILFFRHNPSFIVSEAIDYGASLITDNKSTEVTSSLFRMETQRNSIINVARFATGWVSLTDAKDEYIFKFKHQIDSLLGIIITIAPSAVLAFFLITHWSKLSKNEKTLATIWAIAILLSTSYALIFTKTIPYLGTVLRWISSKLWPLIFIPFVILVGKVMFADKKYLRVILLTALTAAALPWFLGIINKHQQIAFPQEYVEVFNVFDESQSIFYMPEPQRLYMRQYEWGYYGSGFLTYLTKAKILDNGSFHPEQNIYPTLVKAFVTCDFTTLRAHATNIVVDNSTTTGLVSIPTCCDTFVIKQKEKLTVIEL